MKKEKVKVNVLIDGGERFLLSVPFFPFLNLNKRIVMAIMKQKLIKGD